MSTILEATASNEGCLEQEGRAWLAELGRAREGLQVMAGDVSSRRYFRVAGEPEVLAHYPPDLRRSYECFVRTDELLTRAGVPTPRILALDGDRRWMLTEDVGERQLSLEGSPAVASAAMETATHYAQRIQRLDGGSVASLSPSLETELLTREVRRTCQVFFRDRLGPSDTRAMEGLLFSVCETLGATPLLPAHRDYMARNLMVVDGPSDTIDLVVLDHQDLRLAPPGYDIASLFFDSCPLEDKVATDAVDRIVVDEAQRVAVARCAVQRCIKIIGTFVGFAQRGADRYLPMVPGVLRRAASELRLLPEGVETLALLLEDCSATFDVRPAKGDADSSV